MDDQCGIKGCCHHIQRADSDRKQKQIQTGEQPSGTSIEHEMNTRKGHGDEDYCQENVVQPIQEEIEEHVAENRFFQQGCQEGGLEMHGGGAFPVNEERIAE